MKTTHTDQYYRIKKTCLKLQEWNRDKLQKNIMKAGLESKYCVKYKGVNVVIEEIKQRIKAKTTKSQKYDERNNLYKTFQTNQKLLFEKNEGKK